MNASPTPDTVRRIRRTRIAWILCMTALALGALRVLVVFAPVTADLVRPAYWVVAAVGVFTAWRARERSRGSDRRRRDRRASTGAHKP